jgi:hypothetical protein
MLLLLLVCDTNRTLTNLRDWTLCTNGSTSPSQLLQGINSCLRWGAKRAKIEPLGLQLTAKVMSYVVSGSGKEWWSLLHGKSGTKKAAAAAAALKQTTSTSTDISSSSTGVIAAPEKGSGKAAVVHSVKRRKGNSSNSSSSAVQQQQHRSSSKRADSSSTESSLQLQTIQRPQVVLGAGRKKFRKEGEMGVSALS